MNKRTQIIATLGPACDDKTTLKKMIQAGMNIVRLNFSHGTYQQFEILIKNTRQAARELKVKIGILQDLQGPKIRVGKLPPEGIFVKRGQTIILTTTPRISGASSQKNKTAPSLRSGVPVQYKKLPREVKKNHHILINDGLIELKVLSKTQTTITCKTLIGGLILSNKGINVPEADITSPAITAKDKKDLIFGLKHKVDYVALSFVKDAQDIQKLRKLIHAHKSKAKIVAKIERREAIENLAEIIEASDWVMVARGDLGVEMPLHQIPILQKKIIHMSNLQKKPVITATELLTSMIENPRPTRAEVSDVANAVLDHTDALMLSNETSVGKYPVKAVQNLTRIARATEEDMQLHGELQ